jgi:hypothetical protein
MEGVDLLRDVLMLRPFAPLGAVKGGAELVAPAAPRALGEFAGADRGPAEASA